MDKLTAMRAFVGVARLGSFAAAARHSGLSRSQLNRQVLWLEDSLGVSLFNRTTRKVDLTHAGQAYLENILPVLESLDDAESQLQQDQQSLSGTIKINAPMSFGLTHLTPVVLRFMREYPQIQVQLALSDEKRDPLSNQFDMTLRIGPPDTNPALIEHDITYTSRCICAAPSLLERIGEPLTPDALKDMPCLHYGNLVHGNFWDLQFQNKTHRTRINGVLSSNNGDVLKQAAIEGMGLALLPAFIVGEAIRNGQLKPVLLAWQPPPLLISLLYAPNRHMAMRLSVFVKYIQAAFEQADFMLE
ncbi:LysR family transcriptional regulator [Alteromonas lipolytica]|uniref:HTH lysR-type domain-containing protein n=1 Tax=Alteromonas lipolytica TaxID=1856405 RepID=A0A1E8FEA4_9ALTE|nr:LysR family transcriptional regulator [Alteromonas lipolytica]OFI33813.1 hypothetical protein BFC17_19785 [Alteromonas lipolytica]GGF68149.1 LysR family transcriptional regulator [Alteromonas lipolytica]